MKQRLGKFWLQILPLQHQTSLGQITISIHLLSLIFGVNGDCDVHYCLCNREVLGQRRQESMHVIVVQCKISNLSTKKSTTSLRYNIFYHSTIANMII
jgi:hypothetical protein